MFRKIIFGLKIQTMRKQIVLKRPCEAAVEIIVSCCRFSNCNMFWNKLDFPCDAQSVKYCKKIVSSHDEF